MKTYVGKEILRTILKRLGYNGNYVDYGTIGYIKRSIDCPSGEK